jgi:glutaredoxin-like protein NrdH
MEDKNIKLYAVSTCGHCKTLKNMLETERFVFDSVDVDLLAGAERREMLAVVKKVNKRCSFPTMVIGEKVIVGFRENEIKEALGIR